jgi:HK97 family phage prohead protease
MKQPIAIEPWLLERGSANARRAAAFERGGILAMEDVVEMKEPCVQGYAVRTNKLFELDNQLTVFCKHALRDSTRASDVRVQLDHDIGTNFGNCGLELLHDDNGVAFRFKLPGTVRGYALQHMVKQYQRPDVSIGYRPIDSVVKRVEDENVRFITDAAIVEISIVKYGKCPYSYARLIDASVEKSLKQSSERGLILFDGAAQEFTRTLDSITKNARKLSELASELAA